MEQYLPGLLLCSEFLPDPVQALIEVNTQACQDFLLRNVNGLGVPLSPSLKKTKSRKKNVISWLYWKTEMMKMTHFTTYS